MTLLMKQILKKHLGKSVVYYNNTPEQLRTEVAKSFKELQSYKKP